MNTQKFLLSLWHASDPSSASEVSLSTPISYFDRLRIRQPGDSKFALGPHVDGGSIERWEDPSYRSCYKNILNSGAKSNWRDHDPFDVSPRLHANQDMYNASYAPLSPLRSPHTPISRASQEPMLHIPSLAGLDVAVHHRPQRRHAPRPAAAQAGLLVHHAAAVLPPALRAVGVAQVRRLGR